MVRRQRPERAEQADPVGHRERLRAPVAGDPGRRERCVHPLLAHRELPAEDVPEHLAALTKACLDEPPEMVLHLRREAPRPVGGSHVEGDDRRLDRRGRLKRVAGDESDQRRGGVVLDEDREVAHGAGPRSHALGDLPLDHQDATVGAWLRAQQPVQDRARHVVRQVRDHVERRDDERRQVGVQDVRGNQPKRARRVRGRRAGPLGSGRDRGLERRGEVLHHPAVELDRSHRGAGVQQAAGEDPQARPDLEDRPAGRCTRSVEDRLQHVDVHQEVLAEAALRTQAGDAERAPDGARIQPGAAHRVLPRVGEGDWSAAASRSAASAAS